MSDSEYRIECLETQVRDLKEVVRSLIRHIDECELETKSHSDGWGNVTHWYDSELSRLDSEIGCI